MALPKATSEARKALQREEASSKSLKLIAEYLKSIDKTLKAIEKKTGK